MESQSKKFGAFVKSLVKLEQTRQEKSTLTGRDVVFLFSVNPHSTLQLLEARIKAFPAENQGQQKVFAINRLISAYQQLNWSKLSELNLVEAEFWRGYDLAEEKKILDKQVNLCYDLGENPPQKWADSP